MVWRARFGYWTTSWTVAVLLAGVKVNAPVWFCCPPTTLTTAFWTGRGAPSWICEMVPKPAWIVTFRTPVGPSWT